MVFAADSSADFFILDSAEDSFAFRVSLLRPERGIFLEASERPWHHSCNIRMMIVPRAATEVVARMARFKVLCRKVWRGASTLGKDTSKILAECWGLPPEKIQALRAKELILTGQ